MQRLWILVASASIPIGVAHAAMGKIDSGNAPEDGIADPSAHVQTTKRRWNVVLIYADDLARRRLVFDNFYSNAPSCEGVRISLLTRRNLGQSRSMRRGFVPDSPASLQYLAR